MMTTNVDSEFDLELLGQAIEHLERACSGNPGKTRYRRILGEALLAARRHGDALDQLLAVYDTQPGHRTAYLIAHAYFHLGDTPSAEKFITLARERGTIGFSKLHMLRGRVLFQEELFAESANEFSKALLLSPVNPTARWHQARALVAHAERLEDDNYSLFRRAEALLKSYEPTPQHADEWHDLMGRTYLALQYPMEALEHFEQSRQPKEGAKSLLVGLAYLLHGKREEALKWSRIAISDPDLRERCTEHLIEIVCSPPVAAALHESRGTHTGVSLDSSFLESLFGPDAPEVIRVENAAQRGGDEEGGRTALESRPRFRRRLLASRASDPSTQEEETGVETRGMTAPTLESPGTPTGLLQPSTLVDIDSPYPGRTTDLSCVLDPEDEDLAPGIPDIEGLEDSDPGDDITHMSGILLERVTPTQGDSTTEMKEIPSVAPTPETDVLGTEDPTLTQKMADLDDEKEPEAPHDR